MKKSSNLTLTKPHTNTIFSKILNQNVVYVVLALVKTNCLPNFKYVASSCPKILTVDQLESLWPKVQNDLQTSLSYGMAPLDRAHMIFNYRFTAISRIVSKIQWGIGWKSQTLLQLGDSVRISQSGFLWENLGYTLTLFSRWKSLMASLAILQSFFISSFMIKWFLAVLKFQFASNTYVLNLLVFFFILCILL